MEEALCGFTVLFSIPAGSLCKRKTPECDKETSVCTDLDGVALCQCKSGYFQFNKMDHSCRGACRFSSRALCHLAVLCRGSSRSVACSKLGVTSPCCFSRSRAEYITSLE